MMETAASNFVPARKSFNGCIRRKVLWIPFLATILWQLVMVEGFDTSQCTGPLGMESGDIKDGDLSSSTSFEILNVGPAMGRVRVERLGGAWCPKNQITSEAEEWLQIELHTVHVITATETQGRFGNGQGAEFAEAYVISYWRPELNRWVRYRDHTGNEILKGNINTYLPEKTELNPPIIASRIRILPYSYHRRTVCMRVEIYGCQFKGGLLSYSVPQGSMRGENWNLFDHTYDGTWEQSMSKNNALKNGLGQLTDGRFGSVNFKDDFYGHERDYRWVGWKNESVTEPLEIMFKFDSVREFSAMNIYASNQFTKDIQVFSQARVSFSIGGKLFAGDPIIYQTKEDCIFEDPRNVSIKLHHRVGQYVKLQLFWSSKWMLISEVSFDSQPAMGNFTDEVLSPSISSPPAHPHPHMPELGSIAQSDASESISHNRIHTSNKNPILQPPPLISEEWTSATIVLTAVISSFIAIILVLLLILAALLFRNKLMAQGKIPPGNTLGPHYETHHSLDYAIGYIAPEDIRKAKGTSGHGDYQEPFADPQFSSFVVASNGMIGHSHNSTSSGNSNNGSKGKMTEYYSCTLVSNPLSRGSLLNQNDSSNEYEYAVPNELGKLLSNQLSPMRSIPISPSPSAAVNRVHGVNLQLRFGHLGVPQIPPEKLRMLRKLGDDGAFGTVFIGEVEHGSSGDKDLVAVKNLVRNASDKEKLDFIEEVRILSSLNDPNVAKVLGVVYGDGDAVGLVLEFLELGDLYQFLKQNDTLRSNSKKLSVNSLLYISCQIASGMKFLENMNIVHRDLAARNIVVGRGLLVKISHFATDTDLYSSDYYRLDGKTPLPIRWMAWESLFLGKYSTKSDVWSMGVVLWEIFSFCRHSPYFVMNDQEVLHNLRRFSIDDDSDPFEPLMKPQGCPKDVYQLMCDAWSRDEDQRPNFREIHGFLSRKNINFVPPESSFNTNSLGSTTSYFVEHYIV